MGRAEKKKRNKEKLVLILIMIISVLLIVVGNRIAMGKTVFFDDYNNLIVEKAQVTKVIDKEPDQFGVIKFECKIVEGEKKGSNVVSGQIIDGNVASALRIVENGDVIFLGDASTYEIGVDYFLYEYERFNGIIWLAGAFALLLLIFGGFKGIRTIVSLSLTCISIFFVFIPAILSGYNIYMLSIITCLFITFMTLLIVQGPTYKTMAAAFGCVSGFLVVSGLTVLMTEFLKLSGLIDEDSLYLLYLNVENPMNLKAVIFAAITIGAMGAILDIAVDISASLSEVHFHAADISFGKTVKSGITIGQDIVGSMANTLILAYIGSSLSLILLLLVHTGSATDLLNSELIVVEILQAVAGSIGILFTIPLTSIGCGFLYNLESKHDKKKVEDSGVSEIIE